MNKPLKLVKSENTLDSPEEAAAPAASPSPQRQFRLKKGELVFAEGESSRSMYLLKNGVIRIFKKRGSSNVEIGTIHSGQIFGELAFLDGEPRSASAEAITDCQLMEISGAGFADTLKKLPDWMKLLFKTVVGRLRGASNRIKQLETTSSSVSYSDKDPNGVLTYVYLAPSDVLKVLSSILLVASRYGEKKEMGTSVRVGMLQRYCNQMQGVPVAKIMSVIDIFQQCALISFDGDMIGPEIYVTDLNHFEEILFYINEENLLEPAKRHDLTNKAFGVMTMIAKSIQAMPPEKAIGLIEVNVGALLEAEKERTGKETYRLEDYELLSKFRYLPPLNIKSRTEAIAPVNIESFLKSYRVQKIMKSIEACNIQKNKTHGK